MGGKVAVVACVLAACTPPPDAQLPTATATATATPTPTPTATGTATAGATGTATSTPTAIATATAGPRAPTAPPFTTADDTLAASVLGQGGAALKGVLASPETYRFQVLYGVVREGASPSLERHGYRTDAEYFFPASSMKVPVALATFDHAAGRGWLGRDATLRLHPVSGAGEPYVTTLARETWRALIVSDNFAANRLLAIVGHREVHETLWSLGLASARIRAGFATGDAVDPAEVSPRIEVGEHEIAPRRSDLALPPNDATKLDIGKAYIDRSGQRKEGPLSFADKNAMRLRELQDTLVRIVRPELLPGAKPDAASQDDLAYLKKTLGTLPSESGLAGFDRNVVSDYQLVPFLRGIERVRARGKFEIYSKVGQAFGFLIGNAYIVDKDTRRSFFLIAAVYANPSEVENGDQYAYDATSFPALADVAEVFARHAFGG
jgi:hypothetical protein